MEKPSAYGTPECGTRSPARGRARASTQGVNAADPRGVQPPIWRSVGSFSAAATTAASGHTLVVYDAAAHPGQPVTAGQEYTMNRLARISTSPRGFQETRIDIRLRISALWIAIMFIYAYVDIFNLMRADYLESLLDGEIVNTPFAVSQVFLIFAVVYIVPASLMIYFSLTLGARANRTANIVVAGIYIVTIGLACVGEDWLFFLLGSAIEIILFVMVIRLALRWPADGPVARTVRSGTTGGR